MRRSNLPQYMVWCRSPCQVERHFWERTPWRWALAGMHAWKQSKLKALIATSYPSLWSCSTWIKDMRCTHTKTHTANHDLHRISRRNPFHHSYRRLSISVRSLWDEGHHLLSSTQRRFHVPSIIVSHLPFLSRSHNRAISSSTVLQVDQGELQF